MNNSPIICKFSFLCCLLPYYGEFKEWHLLINLCCRDSRSVWRLHHKAFIQLHNLTKWRTHKGEIEDCITRRFNINLNLTSKTNLLLFLDDLSDISFINDVKCLRFPLINRLEICKFERMSIIYYKKMDQFLKKSFSSKIYEFVIGCEISTELDALKQGIKGVLRNTTRVVRLERIKLSKEMLKTVINNLTSAQVLKMVSCSIDGVEDFLIEDESLKELKELDLKRTLKRDSRELMNIDKFRQLMQILSKTHLKEGLKKVHCIDEEFSHQEALQILLDLGYSCIVC